MRYVLKNIASFIHHEKVILSIMILCIFCSALIMNFSYGLYQNYNVQKTEAEYELNEFAPEIASGVELTKGDLKRYVESLSNETLNDMEVTYATAKLDGFPSDEYGRFWMRFTINNGKYHVCETQKKNYENTGRITSGRFISNEEESTGKLVAIVTTKGGKWTKLSEAIRSGDNTISIFGNSYEVVGTYDGGTTQYPIVPFLTVPDNQIVDSLGFAFYKNITRSRYDEMVQIAEEVLPGAFIFPELQFPDTDSIYLYNNIMSISVFIALLSAINFAMLYLYMIKKRGKNLSVFRICGCTKSKAVHIYLGECAAISIPVYLIGTGVYILLMKNIFADIFPNMKEAYSPLIYGSIFLIYLLSMLIILEIVIRSKVSKEITETLKGGHI